MTAASPTPGPAPDPDRQPVIVGVGETIDRPADLARALEPVALMAAAARAAAADAGATLLTEVDSLDLVSIASWRYADAPGLLAQRLGIAPHRAVLAEVGGESPVRLIHEAALRIARGESRVALIVGAEAQHSAAKARRAGIDLPWTPFAKDGPRIPSGRELVHPLAGRYGIAQPTNVYPLYDMASAARWGQTPAEALAESGEVWSRYAAAAAQNSTAWNRRAPDADAIVTPTDDNRLIAWPYTKSMVANPMVNQGAAVIVTSLAAARAAGVAEDRMIHVLGGAAASEPRDFMARDDFTRSHAQDAVLSAAAALAPVGFDAVELYSCFPCVPKMARRTLALPDGVAPTVTGGLSFFGAPLSDYMLHAAAAMARALRAGGGTGLLYGQGEFVTKHHALVLANAPSADAIASDYSVQGIADAARGPVPPTIEPAPGPATLEAATIFYARDGTVDHGVVVLRVPDGGRTVAAVAADDTTTLAAITDPDRFPIGRTGTIVAGTDDRMEWQIA